MSTFLGGCQHATHQPEVLQGFPVAKAVSPSVSVGLPQSCGPIGPPTPGRLLIHHPPASCFTRFCRRKSRVPVGLLRVEVLSIDGDSYWLQRAGAHERAAKTAYEGKGFRQAETDSNGPLFDCQNARFGCRPGPLFDCHLQLDSLLHGSSNPETRV